MVIRSLLSTADSRLFLLSLKDKHTADCTDPWSILNSLKKNQINVAQISVLCLIITKVKVILDHCPKLRVSCGLKGQGHSFTSQCWDKSCWIICSFYILQSFIMCNIYVSYQSSTWKPLLYGLGLEYCLTKVHQRLLMKITKVVLW